MEKKCVNCGKPAADGDFCAECKAKMDKIEAQKKREYFAQVAADINTMGVGGGEQHV